MGSGVVSRAVCFKMDVFMNEALRIEVAIHALHPRNVFRISRGARAEVENVFVRLTGAGVSGFGEASPNRFYGESAADVRARLEAVAPWVNGLRIESVREIADAWHVAGERLAPSRAAQCALDLALWDWLARRRGVSVTELALGVSPRPVRTFCTLGLSEAAEMEAKIAELRGFPLVKIKSDARGSVEPVALVREQTGAVLALDANCAWAGVDLPAVSRLLAPLGVVFLEQPLPPADDPRMAALSLASALPIFADESCVTAADLERLPGRFAGFNVKLVKCGGLTPALAMIRRGRALGLRAMVGCMLESSLLIAAGTVAARVADYADLDGAWLLRDDPFTGLLPFREGVLEPADAPGFGDPPVDGIWG